MSKHVKTVVIEVDYTDDDDGSLVMQIRVNKKVQPLESMTVSNQSRLSYLLACWCPQESSTDTQVSPSTVEVEPS